MAGIEGTRLEAQEITHVLPDTEVLNYEIAYAFKAAFGLMAFILGLWAGTKLGVVSWVKDCILWPVTIFIVFAPLNTEALRWLFSEWQRQSWAIAYLQPKFTSNEVQTSPRTMRKGDYVRIVEGRRTSTIHQAADLTYGGNVQASFPVPRQHGIQRSPESPIYYRVIVKLVEPESGRVSIGLFGRDWHDSDPADSSKQFYRLAAPLPDVSAASDAESIVIAEALDDLIDLLAKNGKPMREEALAGKLINQFGHDSIAVRLTLRIAESGCLVSRRTLSGRFTEQLKVFKRKARVTGHNSCEIDLTDTGRMWESAGFDYRKVEKLESPGVTVNNGDYIRIEGIGNSIGGRGNRIDIDITDLDWKGPPVTSSKALAKELEKLRTELRKQPTSAEQDQAIYDVASALIEVEKGNTDEAMSKLAKLGSRTDHVRKWVIDTATSIGIPLAVAAIKQSWLHIPPGG